NSLRLFQIFYSAAIIIALAYAQRKPNITKPVVNLEKRPRIPVWHRPPEERRKLSFFPKNNVKFVVTPKPVNDEPKESPTKRPLMRKFIMQDKNEKGTWSFAPREPLMKTQRFTVTLAPPKSSNQKAIDHVESKELKKVPIVIGNINTKPKSSKHHNINNGHLIESVKIRKDPSASKNLHKIEQNITKEDILQTAKANYIQTTQLVQKNDTTRPTFSKDLIDVQSFNDSGVVLDKNETGEQFSNESSSHMTEEELSNESYADKSINSEEISSDSIIKNSNSYSGEQISDESSNITEEEYLSNESYLIDDNTNESIETSGNITEEESSNESSSNTASEEISMESSIETSYNFTAVPQELLSDNSDNITDERIPDEIVASEQGMSTEDIEEEALLNRFKRSNNIIEEEILPTTASRFKYTDHEVTLNHDLSYKNINA
ncbi:uncharacterized protein LOC134747401, partial [Cydia strobilella]|uniref:uncharacterized protein LOC134747401 n=1 Tax=Cydia strobilella TaxID=1100964 RepID=UPI003007C210